MFPEYGGMIRNGGSYHGAPGAHSAPVIGRPRPLRIAPVPTASATSPLQDQLNAREERFNAATHGFGLVLGCVGAVVVIAAAARNGTPWQVLACSAYAVTLVAAYAASTMSHFVTGAAARRAFRIADQAIIFLFIAGSYAPIAATWLRGGHWWVLHAAVFGVAAFGFMSKAAFAHRVEVGSVSAGLYLLLGWSPLFAARPLVAAMPEGLSLWLMVGGICYTVGLIFFSYDHRVRYFHAAWHVMVIAGSACHYFGILFYCTGSPRP